MPGRRLYLFANLQRRIPECAVSKPMDFHAICGAARFNGKMKAKIGLDALEPKMLDARSSAAVLSLSSTLSDAMDHDHVVLIMFCHHAGTASPWFDYFVEPHHGRMFLVDSVRQKHCLVKLPTFFPSFV